VRYYLKELETIKAVKSETKGKIKEYLVNRNHELVLKVFSLLEMERRQRFYSRNPKLGVRLAKLGSFQAPSGLTTADIKFIILFGSSARGEAKEGSDVDILLVIKNNDAAFEEQVKAVAREMEALSGKRFSMHTVELGDFRAKWKKEPFYATLWRDHIVLYGDEVFWREVLEMGEPL
jgi:predicted nucleotidyltransferase